MEGVRTLVLRLMLIPTCLFLNDDRLGPTTNIPAVVPRYPLPLFGNSLFIPILCNAFLASFVIPRVPSSWTETRTIFLKKKTSAIQKPCGATECEI